MSTTEVSLPAACGAAGCQRLQSSKDPRQAAWIRVYNQSIQVQLVRALWLADANGTLQVLLERVEPITREGTR